MHLGKSPDFLEVRGHGTCDGSRWRNTRRSRVRTAQPMKTEQKLNSTLKTDGAKSLHMKEAGGALDGATGRAGLGVAAAGHSGPINEETQLEQSAGIANAHNASHSPVSDTNGVTLQSAGSKNVNPLAPSTPLQRRALGVFAIAAVAALGVLAAPVSSGLFLGVLLAFSLLGIYERLSVRWKQPTLAAALLAIGAGLAILGGLLAAAYFVVVRSAAAAQRLSDSFEHEGTLRKLTHRVEVLASSLRLGPIDLTSRLRTGAAEAASRIAGWVGAIAGATLGGCLTLFFTVLTTFFVLRHWTALLARCERMLPLNPMHTRAVMSEFQKVGKEVFVGTILTGLAQGVLACVGYRIAQVPEAVLLGTLTAICSLVPAVGTLLILVPVGVILIAVGHPMAGLFELLWGVLVVGVLSDYVIRPALVGGRGQVPTLITFISLFGGVEVFGLLGLIVGPVIAAVALALLRTYDRALGEI